MTDNDKRLKGAICTILDAIDPSQKGNNGSVANLIVHGQQTTLHPMVLCVYMKADNPLHDVVYALWKVRDKLNPHWAGRSAQV